MKHYYTRLSIQIKALPPGVLAIIAVGVEVMKKGISHAVHA